MRSLGIEIECERRARDKGWGEMECGGAEFQYCGVGYTVSDIRRAQKHEE